MSRRSFFSNLTAACALLLMGIGVTACGSDEPEQSLSCADDTTLVDGQCVPLEHDCPQGEVPTPAGNCQVPDIFCGQGSAYDTSQQRCVSQADVQCGEGTHEINGECRLEGPSRCGTDTVLVDAECRLADDVCGPGTELSEAQCEVGEGACGGDAAYDLNTGECIDLDVVECGEDTLEVDDVCIPQRTFADDLATEATMDYSDGEPIITSPDTSVIFTGTILNEPTHTYDMEVEEGSWITLTIYPRGLPSPGFTLTDGVTDWQRSTIPGLSNVPTRTFVAPSSGAYELTIKNSLSDLENASDFGAENWEYVGVVEVISEPDAQPWESFEEPIGGDLSAPTENWIELDAELDSDLVVLTPAELGIHAHDVTVETWDGDSFMNRYHLTSGSGTLIDTGGLDTVNLHFDAVHFTGASTDYSVSGKGTVTLSPGEFYDEEFEAQAGEVIYLSHRSPSTTPVRAAVYKDGVNLFELDEVLAENQSSYGTVETKRELFYVPEDGTYLVEFENTDSDIIESFVSTSQVSEVPIFELEEGQTTDFEIHIQAEGLGQGDWRYLLIDTPSAAFIDAVVEVDEGEPDITVFDTSRNQITMASTFGTVNEFDVELSTAGVYVVAIRPYEGFSTPAISGGIDVTMEGESVDSLPPGEIYEEVFTVNTFDFLRGTMDYTSGDAPTVRLINPNGQLVFEQTGASAPYDLMELFPGPGEFTLQIENDSDDPLLGFTVETETVVPIDIVDADDGFEHDYEGDPMDAGERDLIIFRPNTGMAVALDLLMASGNEAALRIWDVTNRQLVVEQTGSTSFESTFIGNAFNTYAIELEAISDLTAGYNLSMESTEVSIVQYSETSSPGELIPLADPDGLDDTINIPSCTTVQEINMDIDITHPWRSDLVIRLTNPDGDQYIVKNPTGSANDVIGNLNETLDPVGGEPMSIFEGDSGTGQWTLNVEDVFSFDQGTLNSWTLNLTCEG